MCKRAYISSNYNIDCNIVIKICISKKRSISFQERSFLLKHSLDKTCFSFENQSANTY